MTTQFDTKHETEAYAMGRQDAIAAASWIIDGNTSKDHIAHILSLMDAGDPLMEEFLPREPNLSGEWSGDLTPNKLADEIFGHGWCPDFYAPEGLDHDRMMSLCDAYETGVSDTFMAECERILRDALED